MEVNARIKQLMKERGWTPYRLARASHLSDATIGEDSLSWTLTQEETLSIGARTATMMLNWVTEDGTRGASEQVFITGGDNHIREVI